MHLHVFVLSSKSMYAFMPSFTPPPHYIICHNSIIQGHAEIYNSIIQLISNQSVNSPQTYGHTHTVRYIMIVCRHCSGIDVVYYTADFD
jgi:hypothetical protein